MKRYVFIAAMATAFLGGLVTGKSAFGASAIASDIHSAETEQKCLADNIYFEARNQIHRGMIGVALVTRVRLLSKDLKDHRGNKMGLWYLFATGANLVGIVMASLIAFLITMLVCMNLLVPSLLKSITENLPTLQMAPLIIMPIMLDQNGHQQKPKQ